LVQVPKTKKEQHGVRDSSVTNIPVV
jgi:hypothetical protein